jgi:hypothetical protein
MTNPNPDDPAVAGRSDDPLDDPNFDVMGWVLLHEVLVASFLPASS